jgi:hypothetical protein
MTILYLVQLQRNEIGTNHGLERFIGLPPIITLFRLLPIMPEASNFPVHAGHPAICRSDCNCLAYHRHALALAGRTPIRPATRLCCSPMRSIQPMRRGRSAAGRPSGTSLRSNRRAGGRERGGWGRKASPIGVGPFGSPAIHPTHFRGEVGYRRTFLAACRSTKHCCGKNSSDETFRGCPRERGVRCETRHVSSLNVCRNLDKGRIFYTIFRV